ncbi:Aspartate aminotransferase [BD1-7 clade bacterium]|uniref:Aminotransferase n=1 Tax=BD1-7 clade bacterium TaxID=2029982 RepID=A0A5S9Q1M4_9GAMM|nr:Aspartate aminotransferase [BD1-7 clade bacterium]CAA0112044.1 Aspartate aminotransferase [BD1-7 clade bacterium]
MRTDIESTPLVNMIQKLRCMPENQLADIIQMHIGVPDFGPPDQVVKAAMQAISTEDCYRYPPIQGSARLRGMICAKYSQDYGVSVVPSQVIIANGAKQCLFQIMMALLKPLDEVLIVGPAWSSFSRQVLLAGGVPVMITAGPETGFKISPRALDDAISDKTRLVIMCFPNNPTGAVLDQAEINAYADVIARYSQLYLISDEVYEYFRFDQNPTSFITCESIRQQLILVNGFSKSFGISGWRIGYAIAPTPVIDASVRVQSLVSGGVCEVMQIAACEALEAGAGHIGSAIERYQERAGIVREAFSAVEGVVIYPLHATYFMVLGIQPFLEGQGLDAPATADVVAEYLLEEYKVAVIGTDGFGLPGCLRLSLCLDNTLIKEGCRRIIDGLASFTPASTESNSSATVVRRITQEKRAS